MEVRLKLESRYWVKFLALLKKVPYIDIVEVVKTDTNERIAFNSKEDLKEEDFIQLPPEREALLHLSYWEDESVLKIEQARKELNQLSAKSW